MAPQLMATKGPLCRGLRRWISRAISSLPVPVSPLTSTLMSVPATSSILWKMARVAGADDVSVGLRLEELLPRLLVGAQLVELPRQLDEEGGGAAEAGRHLQ